MISLDTAVKLKSAGLVWRPALHDFFAIPEHGLDDRVFVIGDMLATVELLQGLQVISFQGASEWALDSIVFSEAVWMPGESQLRQVLEEVLLSMGFTGLRLISNPNGYRCEIPTINGWRGYEASEASEAYALAILAISFTKPE
jgi:hypothetical protein